MGNIDRFFSQSRKPIRVSAWLLFHLCLITSACDSDLPDAAVDQTHPTSKNSSSIRYIALGDSYTEGFGVAEEERWPVLLAEKLASDNIQVEEFRTLAKSGWTTKELIAAVEAADVSPTYDLVTMLIGVNNQYQGYDLITYEEDLEVLITKAVDLAGGNPAKVLILSIPDYSVTEYAEILNLNKQQITNEIGAYNQVAKELCNQKGAMFCDITELSRLAGNDPTLSAPDGLHPSGAMYKQWVSQCYPQVLAILSNN
jgi:lysophospholipase L1-like esterase